MKNYMMSSLKISAFAACFAVMGLVGCSDSATSVDDDNSSAMSYSSYGVAADATLQGDSCGARPARQFRGIFTDLNLTADQQGQIQILIQQHRECETPVLDSLRSSEQAIRAPFKIEHDAIHDSLTVGLITRAHADTLEADLRLREKAAMDANPVRAWAIETLTACKDTFFAGVRATLTTEQQVIWDAWVLTLPVDDYFHIGDGHGHHDGRGERGEHGHGKGHGRGGHR